MMAAETPPTNTIVTMRPDVVRLSSFFIQLLAPAVAEKQRSPGAQDETAVTVGEQESVLPALTEQADVDTSLVTKQTRGVVDVPVEVDVVVVLPVLEVVAVALVVVDEAAAVVEAAADDSVDDSDVVVAAALEGALVVFAVVFAVLAVVFASVDGLLVVESSALFFNSS
jgi:hypothetical protein